MKRLILSVLTIGLVSVSAFAATRAYFTDQATVLGNTIETGKVDFRLTGTASQTFTLDNMLPGEWTAPMELNVYNELSTTPIKYRFYDRFVSEDVAGLYDKMNVVVRHTFAGTPNPASWPVIYSGTLGNLYVDSTTTSGIISSSLGVNITHVFYLQFQLDPSANNTYQNTSAVFDIVADGTQFINPGW
jgi:predicted ribosomally synthesized peptide with SipW-like signal peptide